jgi:photoactive yellow protein
MFNQKRNTNASQNPLGTTPGVLPAETLARLPQMIRGELNVLPVGVIQVDDAGVILQYNKTEGDMAGFRAEDVEGKNLFFDLAPCMNNGLVYGKFRAGVDAGVLDQEVLYALTYRMRPVLTQMRLWRDPATATNWILLQRIGSTAK